MVCRVLHLILAVYVCIRLASLLRISMREGTTVGRTVGGGVADSEIVQIIDYQAYLTGTFPCIFRKIL